MAQQHAQAQLHAQRAGKIEGRHDFENDFESLSEKLSRLFPCVTTPLSLQRSGPLNGTLFSRTVCNRTAIIQRVELVSRSGSGALGYMEPQQRNHFEARMLLFWRFLGSHSESVEGLYSLSLMIPLALPTLCSAMLFFSERRTR